MPSHNCALETPRRGTIDIIIPDCMVATKRGQCIHRALSLGTRKFDMISFMV
jgi:hypothetical protein